MLGAGGATWIGLCFTRSLLRESNVGGNLFWREKVRIYSRSSRIQRNSTFAGTRLLACSFLVGITAQEFRQMQERLVQRRRSASAIFQPTHSPGSVIHKTILGLDPSLRGTGYGVIEMAKPTPRTLAYSTIACPPGWTRSRCLARIAESVREVLRAHCPQVCVIEGLFYAQNLQTALILGEARGAVLAAVAQAGLEIYELAPRKVKLAIVGYGAAQKLAVGKMVQRMLRLP